MVDLFSGTAGLWLAVVASGIYHGVNPGTGWPLAVSAALMEGQRGALFRALAALAAGHFAAMIGILLPFALMTMLVQWQVEIRVIAALMVIALGLYLLINRRHRGSWPVFPRQDWRFGLFWWHWPMEPP